MDQTFGEKLRAISPDTWARSICLIIALINQVLAIFGKDALPFAENDVYQLISLIATIVTGIAAWWKNNSFTGNAITADNYLKELKSADAETTEDDE